jgi:hypothetical protein
MELSVGLETTVLSTLRAQVVKQDAYGIDPEAHNKRVAWKIFVLGLPI